ncbi:MAG TPA: hypothetical protein VN766_10655, partial [Stellaceae bacterium]|nr:hypothetical protein [Stellaceae bacterium]
NAIRNGVPIALSTVDSALGAPAAGSSDLAVQAPRANGTNIANAAGFILFLLHGAKTQGTASPILEAIVESERYYNLSYAARALKVWRKKNGLST